MLKKFALSGKSLENWFLLFLFFCVTTVFFSCSSNEPGEVSKQQSVSDTRTSSFALTIVPINATRSTTIYTQSSGFDLGDAKVEWLVNNLVMETKDARQFKAEKAYKGASIQARATINGQVILSNTIQISNSPPLVTNAVFTPEPGDKLSVDAVATDLDGDAITIAYEWTRNGEPAGNARQIDVPLQNGDKIQIKITPFDGELYGKPVILYKQVVKSSD